MFMMHISLLLAYSLLLGSAVLLIWSLRNKGDGHIFGVTIGAFVFVLTLLSILCISYYGLKYWSQGHFETPLERLMKPRQDMMQKMSPQLMQKLKERMEQRKKMQQHQG